MSGGADSFCPRFPGPKEKNQNDGHEPFGSDHGCLVQRNQGGTGLVWHTARPAPDQPPPQENSTDKFYNHKVENKRRVLNFEHVLHHFAVNNSPFGVETTTLLVKAQARFDDFDDFDLPVCTQESSSWPLMTQGAAE